MVPLGEIASIKNGKAITRASATPGPVPVIGGGAGTFEYTHEEPNADGQCFTVSKSGAYSGYAWWHEEPIWASDCMVVRSRDEDDYMTFYLFLCLKAKQEEIYSRQQGTGQPHIYKEHIDDFPIPKRTLAEQWDYVNEVQDVIRQRVDAQRQAAEALDRAVSSVSSAYERDEKAKEKPPYPADYKGATPQQVAKALLTYRPKSK